MWGTIPPSKGVGTASVPPGDVSATVKTAPPDWDIPLGLKALSPFKGGIFRLSLTHYGQNNAPEAKLAGSVKSLDISPQGLTKHWD
jgi:hypothetical protein